MKQNFWQERWESGRIGFHQADVHPMLRRHAPDLLRPNDRILVPLCGKSLDLLFLAGLANARFEQAAGKVLGVEFVEQAVHEFFRENELACEDRGGGRFVAGNIEMHCRDFLSPGAALADLGPATFIYDRAALVALPAEMRATYAKHIATLAAPGAQMLLITFEYDQTKVPGPPFSIPSEIVSGLYANDFTIEERERKSMPPLNPRFVAAKIDSVSEVAYLLRRKS